MEKHNETVFSVALSTLNKLEYLRTSSSGKAILANLRNSISRPYSETIDIWPLLFETLPESFLGKTGKLTTQEKAILASLQLYALHQQGKMENVNLSGSDDVYKNVGQSLNALHVQENSNSMDRRFNVMITSTTFDELIHHLRQLINILKSNTTVKVNYAKLAQDLFWFLEDYREDIRLSWAKSYYRTTKGVESNEQ